MNTDAVDRTESATHGAKRQDHSTPRPSSGSADADGVPALSASIAHLLITKSALHAWTAHPRLNPNYRQEESAEFDYGRAAHACLLEGDESRFCIVDADDWRKKDAKELRDKARADKKMPMLARQVHKVRAMARAAQDYIAASELAGIFEHGVAEKSIYWQEGAHRCRATPDWLTDDHAICLDYKTTTSANPAAFLGMAYGFGYAMQEAFYRRGIKAVHGREPAFVFLLQEKEPPYACSLVAFDPAMREIGDRQADYAIQLWKDYTTRNYWPGYSTRIAHLEPPDWYRMRAEERMISDEQLEEAMQP